MKITRYLKRERVHHALSAVYNYPLTILEAPMGFGKTTAVKLFAESEQKKPVWITCKKFGNVATSFLDRLVAEIDKSNPQIAKALNSLGFPMDGPQLEKFLLFMSEMTFDTKTLIVIDDYQFAQNEQLHKLILLLAEEEIDRLHILIVTRDTTEINFVELLSKGLCHIISREQLRFNDEEIAEYCHMMSHHINELDIKQISQYTEGWISFIYIILMSLDQGIPLGMNTTVEELIEQALFNNYDTSVQDFLLKISIMDDFTALQAEYLTQNPHTAALLKRLNKENAFVFYDEKSRRYKIHNVLLDFLRLKQNFSAELYNELYARLGNWYYNNNEFTAAYTYLNKAGETQQILAHLNNPSNICDDLTEFEGSKDLFKAAPLELLYQYPFSYLQHIFLSVVKEDISNISEWKERLNNLEDYYQTRIDIEETDRNRVLGEILVVRKFTQFNHLEEIKASNSEILKLFNGQNSYIAIQDNSFTFGSPHYTYLYFRDAGSFKKIADFLSEDVGYAKFSNGCGTGGDSLALAEYALETGDFGNVEINCERARIKADRMAQTSILICSNFTLMRYYLLEGKLSEAAELIKSLGEKAALANNSLINTAFDLCRGYLYACLGQPEEIPAWLQTGNMSEAYLVYEGVAFNYLVYGKSILASKRYAELEIMTTHFDSYFSEYSNQLGFIHNGIFKAAAAFHLSGMAAGVSFLQKVLDEAAQDKIIMPFIEASPHISEMLISISAEYPDQEFIQRILSLSYKYMANLRRTQHNPVPLSPREIDILSLLDAGLSRKQIAEELFISPETAKTHMKNIYQKLNVYSKVSAINIAKMHGYL